MKSEKELIDLATEWGSAHMEDSTVVFVDGAYYPLSMGQLVNPLDPINLLECMPGNNIPDHRNIPHVLKILNTLFEAQMLRTEGYEIIGWRDSGSGAPSVIKRRNGRVEALGHFSKEHSLYYPLLSAQLADSGFVQDRISPWSEYGFRTPPHYMIDLNCYVDHRDNLMDTRNTTTRQFRILNLDGSACLTVDVQHVEVEYATISDSDNHDLEYFGQDFDVFSVR